MSGRPAELRFGFGKNWQSFRARSLNSERVDEASSALIALVGRAALEGASFLDIGSGSGLMSLAAIRSGASRVVSFDSDDQSVSCTQALRAEASPPVQQQWQVMRGSVLDRALVESLGSFDFVYSWGVLHHTGQMWRAVEHAILPVRAGGGRLAMAVYNRVYGKLGTFSSESWRAIKRTYNRAGPMVRTAMVGAYAAWRMGIALSQLRSPLREIRDYRHSRGMSWLHDAVDWVGGYPYEYASTEEVERFIVERGLRKLKIIPTATNSWGNNQFVFERP